MATESRTSNEKISEALELLNEAAQEKREELASLMADKYGHFKNAVATGLEQGREVIKHAQEITQGAIVKGKEIASDVDRRVHKDPWIYIAGTAVTALLLGYFMGSKRK